MACKSVLSQIINSDAQVSNLYAQVTLVVSPEKHDAPAVFTITNVDNNKIRIEKNNDLNHVPLAFLSIPLAFVPHQSAFFPVLGIVKRTG